jgi:O-antigen/teichoic acid export membrane protein
MLVYSYPILFSALLILVQQWAGVTILYGLTGSLVYTGAYYLGLAGAGLLSPIANSITNVVFPTLSSKHGRAEAESFRNTLRIAERALNVLVIPASFGLAAIAPTAVTVAYGRNYLAATIPFAILVASTILVAYQSLMAIVLQSIARTQPLLKIASVAAVTQVMLIAVLVVPLNVVGAAMGRLGMVLVSLLVTYWYVKGEWWPSLDKQQLVKCLALSGVIAAVLYVFSSYFLSKLAISSLSKLLLDAGVFAVVYLCGLVILKPLHPEDIDLLKAAIPSRLHGPLKTLERRIIQS